MCMDCTGLGLAWLGSLWQLNGISVLGRDSKIQAHAPAMPSKLKLGIPHTERFVSRAQAQIETVYGFLPMLSSEASREPPRILLLLSYT